MADIPQSLRYERLASNVLDAAAAANTRGGRIAHLNRAAEYAHVGERLRPGSPHSVELAPLVARLSAVLKDVDRLRLGEAAVHINIAILVLGGPGIPPPEA